MNFIKDNPQFALCLLEFLAIATLNIKLLVAQVRNNIYKTKRINYSFWFYESFAIILLAYSLVNLHVVTGRLVAGFDYIRSLLFTGSLVPLQVYCYKLVADKVAENPYEGDIRKTQQRFRRCEAVTYPCCLVNTFLVATIAGVAPLAPTHYLFRPEILAILIFIVALVELVTLYSNSIVSKHTIHNWIVYIALSILTVPASLVIPEILKTFANNEASMQLHTIFLRVPFTILRLLQIICFCRIAFSKTDLGDIYDRID